MFAATSDIHFHMLELIVLSCRTDDLHSARRSFIAFLSSVLLATWPTSAETRTSRHDSFSAVPPTRLSTERSWPGLRDDPLRRCRIQCPIQTIPRHLLEWRRTACDAAEVHCWVAVCLYCTANVNRGYFPFSSFILFFFCAVLIYPLSARSDTMLAVSMSAEVWKWCLSKMSNRKDGWASSRYWCRRICFMEIRSITYCIFCFIWVWF